MDELDADETINLWKLFENINYHTSVASREGGVAGKEGNRVKQVTIR